MLSLLQCCWAKKRGKTGEGRRFFLVSIMGSKIRFYFLLGDTLINPIPSKRFYIVDCSEILHQLIGKYPGPLFTVQYLQSFIHSRWLAGFLNFREGNISRWWKRHHTYSFMLVCFLVAGIFLGEIDSERFPLLTFHYEWQPTKQELVKLTSHNATSIHVTRPQVLANRSWKWWLTQQPRWLPEQAGNVDQFEVFKVSTPPKFNIDTKNDGLEIYKVYILIISFQTWQLWVFQIWKGFQEDSQIFRGGKGEKIRDWRTKTDISCLKREAFLFGPWIPMKRCRV